MESTRQLLSRKFDLFLPLAVAVLTLIGLSTLQSTVVAGGDSNPLLTPNLINIQIIAIGVGVLLATLVTLVDYRMLKYGSLPMYLLIIAMLGGVLLFGVTTRGSTRWFDLGFFNFQPSSASQVLFIIVLAAYLSQLGEKINQLRYFLLSIAILAVPVVLLLLEPDLGGALILIGIWASLVFASQFQARWILILAGLLVLIVPFGWGVLAEYQKLRILSFINPNQDPLGAGYNLIQSIIAVGSGGVWGRGWGRGTQSHLQFLPEQHTDFIFATYAEEQGFLGAMIVLFLFGVIFWRLLITIIEAKEPFAQMIGVGVLVWLAIHVFVNIGMNVGIAPVTGIPLPFMSYGGTAMITAMIMVGLIESIRVHQSDW